MKKPKLPKKIKIGDKWFTVDTMERIGDNTMGRIKYSEKRIEIGTSYSADEIRNTFWHEVVHGILNDMGSSLCDNERFVTSFANKLSDAIDSAKF